MILIYKSVWSTKTKTAAHIHTVTNQTFDRQFDCKRLSEEGLGFCVDAY